MSENRIENIFEKCVFLKRINISNHDIHSVFCDFFLESVIHIQNKTWKEIADVGGGANNCLIQNLELEKNWKNVGWNKFQRRPTPCSVSMKTRIFSWRDLSSDNTRVRVGQTNRYFPRKMTALQLCPVRPLYGQKGQLLSDQLNTSLQYFVLERSKRWDECICDSRWSFRIVRGKLWEEGLKLVTDLISLLEQLQSKCWFLTWNVSEGREKNERFFIVFQENGRTICWGESDYGIPR